jgi:hypothetical protein
VVVEASLWSATPDAAPDESGRRPDRPRLTTDPDGKFAFAVPKGQDGDLTVLDDDLILAEDSPGFQGAMGDQDLGDLVAMRSGVLQGIVQDEVARPVADVEVEATLGPLGFGSASSTKSAADGTFTIGKLRTGMWHVRTASSRFLPTTLDLALAAGQRHSDLVLVVRPGNAIAGQVVDERGVGVAGIKVGSRRREVSGTLDVERFSSDEATTTDAGGFFTLAGLKQGTVTLRAFGPGHASAVVQGVAVGTGDVVLRMQRLATIAGVLVGTDGASIVGSKVTVETERASAHGWDFDGAFLPRGDATTGADGSFRLESVVPGRVKVAATGKAHRTATQTGLQVEPGQALRGIRLVADAGATARVLVVDVDGKAIADAEVCANVVPDAGNPAVSVSLDRTFQTVFGGEGEQLRNGTTGSDGRATLSGLPVGKARFTAAHEAFAPARAVEVQLPPTGETDVRLVLQVPGFADVHVVGTDGTDVVGAQLQVASTDQDGGPSRPATTGPDGRVRVGPLAPGEHTAVLRLVRRQPQGDGGSGDGPSLMLGGAAREIESSRQKFVVTAGATTMVELRRPVLTRLHGTVLGPEGPVPACTVELEHRGDDDFVMPGFSDRSERTAADGSFAFEDIEAGDYTLCFGTGRQVVKARQAVQVRANVRDLRQDLVLRTGRVVLRVSEAGSTAPIEGAVVELTAESADGTADETQHSMITIAMSDGSSTTMTMTLGAPRAHTDAEGRAEIDDVPVGSYTVRVSHDGCEVAEKKQQLVVERGTTDCGRIQLQRTEGK